MEIKSHPIFRFGTDIISGWMVSVWEDDILIEIFIHDSLIFATAQAEAFINGRMS